MSALIGKQNKTVTQTTLQCLPHIPVEVTLYDAEKTETSKPILVGRAGKNSSGSLYFS